VATVAWVGNGHFQIVVIIHDEPSTAHNLEPMNNGLCARETIEVRVRSRFLVRGDVRGFPTEKEIKKLVDNVSKKGRVDDVVPQRGGGEDSFTTENEIHEGG